MKQAVLLAALALAVTASAQAPRPPLGFERVIAPFPVSDSARQPWPMPFLGGFDSPRPSLVDIDADGDLDLFIQEFTGSLMFFEQVQDGGSRFVWRTDRYADLNIGEWYRFADIDGDGDQDLFAELPYSYMRMWRNDGGPRTPRFVPVGDTLRDTRGQPVFADRQNIAQIGDVDCDGRPDLLIGRVDGTVSRYELGDFASDGAPRWRFLTDRFEDIEIIGMVPGVPPRPSMHGANTMALADLDGDGDNDLLWGDFFEPGLLLIENIGGCRQLNLHGTPVGWPVGAPLRTSGYNAPAVGDLDKDGNLDVLVGVLGGAFNPTTTAQNNLIHLTRSGGAWHVGTRRFLGQLDVGSDAVPALADIDGDGDLDLLVSNRIEAEDQSTGALYLFRNAGTARAPALRAEGRVAGVTGFQPSPVFADMDGDGDLDLVSGGFGPALRLFRNEGTRSAPRYVLADSSLARIPRGSSTIPALADLDGDGDLDLVAGEAAGNLNLFRNTGSRTAPAFEVASETWLDIAVGRRAAPSFADLDGDGDLDLVVGAGDGTVRAWRNDGPATAPVFVPLGELMPAVRGFSTPVLGDLTGDGRPELLVGNSGGGLVFYQPRP